MEIAGILTVVAYLLGVVVLSVLVAAGSVWLAGRFLDEDAGREYNVALAPFLTTAALVYGALLGFTTVVAWEQFSSADDHVTTEASTLASMYRQTVAMPAPESIAIRGLLRRYTAAAQAQWGSPGLANEEARAAITDMYRVLGQQAQNNASSAIDGEFLSQVNELSSQRNVRMLDARPRIPGLLWCALLFGAVMVIGLLGFSKLPSRRGHLLLSSAVAILLGLLLYVVFWLDHPFGQQAGVTAAPFGHAVEVFDSIDQAK
jgi:Protein of unknown function (DUF4239)